jgi:hypothetical protein
VKRTRMIAHSALICCSLLAGYILVEVGYRSFAYVTFYERVRSAAGRALIDAQGSVFDQHTGYRYQPNGVFPNFRTNSHGLIAREDFPVEKPADEYRIGAIGDSFTANTTSTIRWTDVVEDALNTSTAWRLSAGGRRTRVINFGLDGIGFPQFGAVAERMALPFDLLTSICCSSMDWQRQRDVTAEFKLRSHSPPVVAEARPERLVICFDDRLEPLLNCSCVAFV